MIIKEKGKIILFVFHDVLVPTWRDLKGAYVDVILFPFRISLGWRDLSPFGLFSYWIKLILEVPSYPPPLARLHFLTCQVESCTFPLTCRHMAAVRLTVLR